MKGVEKKGNNKKWGFLFQGSKSKVTIKLLFSFVHRPSFHLQKRKLFREGNKNNKMKNTLGHLLKSVLIAEIFFNCRNILNSEDW